MFELKDRPITFGRSCLFLFKNYSFFRVLINLSNPSLIYREIEGKGGGNKIQKRLHKSYDKIYLPMNRFWHNILFLLWYFLGNKTIRETVSEANSNAQSLLLKTWTNIPMLLEKFLVQRARLRPPEGKLPAFV